VRGGGDTLANVGEIGADAHAGIIEEQGSGNSRRSSVIGNGKVKNPTLNVENRRRLGWGTRGTTPFKRKARLNGAPESSQRSKNACFPALASARILRHRSTKLRAISRETAEVIHA
jgi:hypothetical protein